MSIMFEVYQLHLCLQQIPEAYRQGHCWDNSRHQNIWKTQWEIEWSEAFFAHPCHLPLTVKRQCFCNVATTLPRYHSMQQFVWDVLLLIILPRAASISADIELLSNEVMKTTNIETILLNTCPACCQELERRFLFLEMVFACSVVDTLK